MFTNDNLFVLFVATLIVMGIWWLVAMIRKYGCHKNVFASPLAIGAVGLTVAGVLGFIPAYRIGDNAVSNAFLSSVQHTMRLFVVDDSITDLLYNLGGQDVFTHVRLGTYKALLLVIVILAPVTTFTAIMTIFARIWYRVKNRITFSRDKHVFSELNDRSLALARSIRAEWEEYRKDRKNGVENIKAMRRPLIVFADIIDKSEEAHLDLVDNAKKLGAILFRKDLATVKWAWRKNKKISFYLISDDEAEKLRHAKFIMENYDNDACKLYLFTNSYSDPVETEIFMRGYADRTKESGRAENEICDLCKSIEVLIDTKMKASTEPAEENPSAKDEPSLEELLSRLKDRVDEKNRDSVTPLVNSIADAVSKSEWTSALQKLDLSKTLIIDCIRAKRMKISGMRINEIRFLVYQYLYDHGAELFFDAINSKVAEGENKIINTTIVGYGKHGKEFLKALLWYSQLPGYKVNITVMDSDETAESRFKAEFPELKIGEDLSSSEDVRYKISFRHVAFGTNEFVEAITEDLTHKHTHFFVCLGDDNLNVRASQVIQRERGRMSLSDGLSTKITTIIRNVDVKELISSNTVSVIGDFRTYYSVKTFSADNLLVKGGLDEHSVWDKRQAKDKRKDWDQKYSQTVYSFSEYCFNSSIAKSLHRSLRENADQLQLDEKFVSLFKQTKTREKANEYENTFSSIFRASMDADPKPLISDIPTKTLTALEEEISSLMEAKTVGEEDIGVLVKLGELRAIAESEHVRWSAYMRSEGWKHSAKRQNEYKLHTDLVPVSDLACANILNDI